MNTETQLYKAVNALQQIEAGEHYYKSRHQADIARRVLDEINAEKGKEKNEDLPSWIANERTASRYPPMMIPSLGWSEGHAQKPYPHYCIFTPVCQNCSHITHWMPLPKPPHETEKEQ